MSLPRAHPSVVDVVGVGLNAADTIIAVPQFPKFNSKTEFSSAAIHLGGQVASAMIACSRWGLKTRYVGTTGDDLAADLHAAEMVKRGVEAHIFQRSNCTSQVAYILAEKKSGERTILWQRDARLALRPSEIRREWITNARALLVDGHDAIASAYAAKCAREIGIPVVADVDNIYPGLQVLLKHTDYLFSSQEFPRRFTKHLNILAALRAIRLRFSCRVAGATLGRSGAIAWDGVRFHYSRGFRIRAMDTTGAGDIFHAGIVYGLLRGWDWDRTMNFSNAAAALACTAVGARGCIATLPKIFRLMSKGRRSKPAFSAKLLARYNRT